ncbi:uncharacterized protein EAE98_009745 [Botrytis deweyae]|uniref:Uncharacterized protein n=1 Tax=Botrytis deweyae TaxID=2478750 RepID=A0ABQ7IAR3_9HELO|nr:uncharacterized protein EAE98_009745 [Botrytis deweyae]KAF7918502.1 hypothetical protein EAE98_009745 [Botrytis deweyae]
MRASIIFLLQFIGTDNEAWKILAPEINSLCDFHDFRTYAYLLYYHPYSEEEESAQIDELELLVQDFESKYIELAQPILKFFDGYWRSRMLDYDTINTKPHTRDELENIRELGVRI